MCGRFALSAKTNEIEKLVPNIKIEHEIKPRYNIAPTQNINAVLNDGERYCYLLKWGLIPFWAKDESIGNSLINARAESLDEKPAFKTSFKRRRCLIFADGFYEWRKDKTLKKSFPYFFRLKTGEPFTFAGLWDVWRNSQGDIIHSATLITTEPNKMMIPIHDRMPVILLPEDREKWISNEPVNTHELSEMLKPYPDHDMECYPVSYLVNNPAYDDPQCIEPLEEFPGFRS